MMRRTFTVAQANALIPYLREQFTEARRLAKELRTLRLDAQEREHARALQSGGRASSAGASMSDDQLKQIAALEDQIRVRIEETASLGIEVRRVDGLVDFPAWIDGQMGFLCWRFGEDKIGYWHPTTAGFEGRRALPETVESKSEIN